MKITGERPGDTTVTYDKGGWVFWMLTNLMGRERSLSGMQAFIKEYHGNRDHPVLQDFIASMRPFAADAAAFDAFVQQWFFQVVVPEYQLHDQKKTLRGQQWEVKVKLENSGTGTMPVEVAATRGERFDKDGTPKPDYHEIRVTITLKAGESQDVTLTCPFEPDALVVDPDAKVLQLQTQKRDGQVLSEPRSRTQLRSRMARLFEQKRDCGTAEAAVPHEEIEASRVSFKAQSELRLARHSCDSRSRCHTNLVVPGTGTGGIASGPNSYARRTEIFFRRENQIGRDRLTRVGRGAAHEREQRALRGGLAIVDRLASPDRGKHLVVLDLVHVGLGAAVSPFVLARNGIAEHVGDSLRAQDIVFHLGVGLHPVAAMVIAAHIVGIFINDREVVVNIAIFRVGARLPAADTPAAHGRLVPHDPAHRVDSVHGLFDDMIARKPRVVVPVAHLVFHVGAARFTRLPGFPDAVRVVRRLDRDDIADLAVEDLFHRFAPRAIVSASRIR